MKTSAELERADSILRGALRTEGRKEPLVLGLQAVTELRRLRAQLAQILQAQRSRATVDDEGLRLELLAEIDAVVRGVQNAPNREGT